jgi:hypothetical protein
MSSPILWVLLPFFLAFFGFVCFILAPVTYGLSLIPFFACCGLFFLHAIRHNDKRVGREAFDDKRIATPERWNELMEVVVKNAKEENE